MEKVRFAVIGTGNIGKFHIKAIQDIDESQVTVICNRHGDEGKRLAADVGGVWVSDYLEAVNRDDVDAVSICTPSGTHMEIAIAAFKAGKHVMIEKPVDVTLARIDALLSAAEASKGKLGCIFQSRTRQGARMAKQALQQGRLGKLLLANAFIHWHRSDAYYANGWRGTFQLDGGGVLMNQSIHSIDLLRWLAGPVESVYANIATHVRNIEGEDTAAAFVQFASGTFGAIQGATSLKFGQPARIELHGSEGSIVLLEGRLHRWDLADATEEEKAHMLQMEAVKLTGAQDPVSNASHESHRDQIADFVQAIIEDREPLVSGQEARQSVEIVQAIYQSARQGRVVTLPLQEVEQLLQLGYTTRRSKSNSNATRSEK